MKAFPVDYKPLPIVARKTSKSALMLAASSDVLQKHSASNPTLHRKRKKASSASRNKRSSRALEPTLSEDELSEPSSPPSSDSPSVCPEGPLALPSVVLRKKETGDDTVDVINELCYYILEENLNISIIIVDNVADWAHSLSLYV